ITTNGIYMKITASYIYFKLETSRPYTGLHKSVVRRDLTRRKMLFNNLELYSVNDLFRPLHVNVLYHRVRSGR
ncbi:hypothetical protein ACUVPF_005141, partial [Escherichia coli]